MFLHLVNARYSYFSKTAVNSDSECYKKTSFKIPDVICNTYLMMSLDEKDVMVISCSRMVNLKAMEVASFEV